MTLTVRQALLDDTAGISALFRAEVNVWQRLDSRGHVETVPYDALTIYERWTHGGAWLSVETAAVHLARLLRGLAIPLVALDGRDIVGYAEVFPGDEPAPLGTHLHITRLLADAEMFTASDALLRHLFALCADLGCTRLTTALVGTSDDRAAFYAGYGFKPLAQVQRWTIPTKSGQVFYKMNDFSGSASLDGWAMPVGRTESAAARWEALMPRHWDVIPQLAAQKVYRLSLNVAGQEALIHAAQHPFEPRRLDVSLWSPRPLTAQMLSALRDWGERQGYRALTLITDEVTARLFSGEAESDPFKRVIYAATTDSV